MKKTLQFRVSPEFYQEIQECKIAFAKLHNLDLSDSRFLRMAIHLGIEKIGFDNYAEQRKNK